MSRLTICTVDPKGECVPSFEFRNSWGGAALIWDYFTQKYFPPDPDKKPWEQKVGMHRGIDGLKPVWDLFERDDIPYHELVVLGSTFDFVMVRGEDLNRLADAFSKVYDSMIQMGIIAVGGSRVEHISTQAGLFREIASNPLQPTQAICWQQTSVAADMWRVSDGGEECRPYNINTDSKHWFLFDELDERFPREEHSTTDV